VPQFLLDELLADPNNRGGRIIVTQPRRLAATSVAARVAQERGEQLGQSIGYQVYLLSAVCCLLSAVYRLLSAVLYSQSYHYRVSKGVSLMSHGYVLREF
jgi:hypothetical protein